MYFELFKWNVSSYDVMVNHLNLNTCLEFCLLGGICRSFIKLSTESNITSLCHATHLSLKTTEHIAIKSDIMNFKKVVIPPKFHKIFHFRLKEGYVVNRLQQS